MADIVEKVTKVSLVGDKEYKQSLAGITNELKRVRAESKAEQAEMKAAGDAAKAAAAKQAGLKKEYELLNKRLTEHQKQLTALEKAGQKDSKAYNDIAVAIAKTRESMANLKTGMETVDKGSKENKQSLQDLGNTIKDLTGNLSGLGDGLNKIGKMSGFAAGLMAVKTAASGVKSIVTGIADACTKLVDGVTSMVTGAADAAAAINNISLTTGIPASEVTKFVSAAQLSGSGGFNSGSISSFYNAWKGNFETVNGIDENGSQVGNVSFKGMGDNALLATLANSTGSSLLSDMIGWMTANQGTEGYDQIVDQAFRRLGLGSEWLQLSQDPQKLLEAMNSGAIVGVNDEEIAILTELNGTLALLGTNIENMKMTIVAPFANDLKAITTSLNTLITAFSEFWNADSPEDQQTALDKLMGEGSVLATALDTLVAKIQAKFDTLVSGLQNSDNPTLQEIGNILSNMPSLTDIWESAKTILNGIFDVIMSILKVLNEDSYYRYVADQHGGIYGENGLLQYVISNATQGEENWDSEAQAALSYGIQQGWYDGIVRGKISAGKIAEFSMNAFNYDMANGIGAHAEKTDNGGNYSPLIDMNILYSTINTAISNATITVPEVSVDVNLGQQAVYGD